MATEREKEGETELERLSALYTNCLLLGIDPALLGGSGGNSRVGHFRHSNPRMGEQLLSALRGPAQSAKDFDKVWPIFDSVQSRDFRKIVQGIISELEALGALPRSNSRVSSLATCCGPRERPCTHQNDMLQMLNQVGTEILVVGKAVDSPLSNDHVDCIQQEDDYYSAPSIRRAVRVAALAKPSSDSGWSADKSSYDESEHFFIPLSAGVPQTEIDPAPIRRKQRLCSPQIRTTNTESRSCLVSDISNGFTNYINSVNGHESATSVGSTGSGVQRELPDLDECLDQVFSPILLVDSSFSSDTYEDLLAPLSDTDML